jgi:hypothetical protein
MVTGVGDQHNRQPPKIKHEIRNSNINMVKTIAGQNKLQVKNIASHKYCSSTIVKILTHQRQVETGT